MADNTRNKEVNERDPDFTNILNKWVSRVLYESNFAIPGSVDSYNATKKTVEVTPLIKRVYLDGEVVTLPRIPSVPVVFPQASNFSLTFPLAKGDEVLLIFSQRSLEQWKTAGGIVEPKDLRRNNLSDAIAIPGLTFPGGGDEGDVNNLVLRFYNAKITIDPTGTVDINDGNLTIDL